MGAPRAQIITEARASGAPVIERSLHFDNLPPLSGWSENPYQHLYKRMPRYGNDRCFTYSCWFKRDQIYGQQGNEGHSKQYLIASEGDTSVSFVRFNNDNGADTLRILGPNSDLITEANFRDTLGWYHVVVAVDTTQATAANRVKLYVNGVQFSDWWSSGNTFPPQNQDYTFFDEVNHLYIGYSTTDGPNHNTFRGWMSEVYMLPGAQLPPTEFGFEDPLTGTWRPKKFNFDQQYQAVFNAPFSSIPSTDSSGNSITITDPSSGGVSVASAGSNNFGITNALNFGGGNDDLIVCGSSAFDGTGTIDMSSIGYTIDFYLKADGDLASGHSPLTLYFDPGVASGDRACRFYMDGNALVLGFENTSGCTLASTLNTDWHHVRFSGSGIWFDGTYIQDPDFTRLIGLNTAVRVLYGGYNSVTANTYKWKGMLGPLRIMNGDLGAPPPGGLVTNSGNLPNGATGGPSGMSLYLPFDGAKPIGENRRRDPSFAWDLTPVNFGGSRTTSSATGAYPTYDTVSGGRIIRGGIRGTVGIGVTVYNSKYYLDGEEAPSLSQYRGQTITFNTSDSTVSGHPFRFATAADAAGSTQYTKSIVTGASESSAGAATTITFPHDAPNTLYYYCTNHNGMGGSIGLSTDHKIADPCAWKCMFATPLIWDQNDVSASIAATITSNLAVANNNVEWPRIESQFYPNAAQFVNGQSRYLTPTYHADAFGFNSMGDFTIEAWIYHVSQVSGGSQIFGTGSGSTYQCGISVIQHGGYPDYCLNVEFNANSPTRFRSIDAFPLFQWHHFAFVRHSGTGYLYLDGVLQESKSLTVSESANAAYIGRPQHTSGAYRWNGYISDFKIYNGVAKYTSEFIPASTDPDIQLNSPSGVVHSSKLGKLKTGGVSFGTEQAGYMTVVEDADWDFGTGDYTAEAWVYMTGTDNYVFATLISGSWWGLNFWTNNSSWSIRAGYNSKHEYTGIRWNYRQWYHIAVSRKSGTSMLFLDGKLIDSQSDTDNLDSTGALQIGRDANSWNKKFSGVISNARIVKGRALYTGNFTVPTEPLKNVPNTVLLCCQSQTSATKYAVSPGAITAGTSDTVPQPCNVFDSGGDIVMGNSSSYATLNPLVDDHPGGHQWRFYQNNLKAGKGASQAWSSIVANVGFKPTGKWQYECTPRPRGSGNYPYSVKVGWVKQYRQNEINNMNESGALFYDMVTGGACKYQLDGGTQTTYGPAIDSPGEVMTLALDFENKVAKLAVDGVVWTDIDISGSALLTQDVLIPCFIAYYGDADHFWDFNFGQKPFQYSFGEGYQTICTANSYDPGQANPTQQFAATKFVGSGAARQMYLDFQPDMVWFKDLDNSYDWRGFDSVRGMNGQTGVALYPNLDAIPGANNSGASNNDGALTANGGGYLISTSGDRINKSAQNIVAYGWKAGGNKNTFNVDDVGFASFAASGTTAGTITPTGTSIGTKQGFSIIKYTGSGSAGTIPHGLSDAPKLVIIKCLDTNYSWVVGHDAIGWTDILKLESSDAKLDRTYFNDTAPTNTVVSVSGENSTNKSGENFIMYAWADNPGVQKFGSYIGNGNADGPYITLGFKPALLVYKKTSGGENWQVYDNARNLWNPTNKRIRLDLNNGQDTGNSCDMYSDGFKIRNSDSADNTNDAVYIYMAWAHNPFHNLYGATAPAF